MARAALLVGWARFSAEQLIRLLTAAGPQRHWPALESWVYRPLDLCVTAILAEYFQRQAEHNQDLQDCSCDSRQEALMPRQY